MSMLSGIVANGIGERGKPRGASGRGDRFARVAWDCERQPPHLRGRGERRLDSCEASSPSGPSEPKARTVFWYMQLR